MIKKSNLIVLFLISVCGALQAQQMNYTLQRDYLWGIDKYYNSSEQNFQTFVKPFRYADIYQINDSSSTFPRGFAGLKAKAKTTDKNENKSLIEISPLVVAETGYQLGSVSRMTNDLAIGASLNGDIGKKFSFNFKALAGRAVFNSSTDSMVRQTHVVPGMGYAYRANTDSLNTMYAYQYYSGYLSYSPNKIFNFQVGNDKQFWGDGYRSLFLSDVAAPYPYLKITTNIWHLTYVNLYTMMKDVTNPSGMKSDWLNKYATFHYLGWNVTKRINVGLFESIVWQGSDSTRYRGYDVNYLNPVMFYRPTEYSLGSTDNALLGFSLKIKLWKKQQVYGQLLLDEFLLKEVGADVKHVVLSDNSGKWGWWANKQAVQLGLKSFDLFGFNGLNFQTEYNLVRPYTYSHGSVQQNYAHFNQPLAHPLGANFWEQSAFLNYRIKRFFIEAKLVYAVYGADSAGTDYGKNIFISYTNHQSLYYNFTTQGFQATLITSSLRVAYVLDARMNLKLELGLVNRTIKTTSTTQQSPGIFIGLRTDLCNLYSDY